MWLFTVVSHRLEGKCKVVGHANSNCTVLPDNNPNTIFNLQKGECEPVIQTTSGYHLKPTAVQTKFLTCDCLTKTLCPLFDHKSSLYRMYLAGNGFGSNAP